MAAARGLVSKLLQLQGPTTTQRLSGMGVGALAGFFSAAAVASASDGGNTNTACPALAATPRALFLRTSQVALATTRGRTSSARRRCAAPVRASAAAGGEEKPAAAAAAATAGDDGVAAVAAPPKKILKKKPVYSMKKGQIVRVDKEKYLNSINYLSVGHPPFFKGLDYIYEDRGEVLDIRIFETGEYALIAWVGIPTPPAWLPTYMLIKSDKLDYERI